MSFPVRYKLLTLSNPKMLRVFSPKYLCWWFLRRLNRCWWLMLDNRCIGDKSRHQYQELSWNPLLISVAAYYNVGNRLKRYQHAENIQMSPTRPSWNFWDFEIRIVIFTSRNLEKNLVSLNQISSKNCPNFTS